MDSLSSKTPQPATGLRAISRYSFAFWLVAALIAAAMLVMHLLAGLTLPVPWGDEAFFIWQARAFERFNHFAAPELDASRPILLLPFIYQSVLGIAFKIFGYSLGLAREISFLFALTGFAFIVATARRGAAPIAALVLISGFMMSAQFIALANNARMEAMLFAFVGAALFLMQVKRGWFAIALLAITPMIHPNGMLYLIPACVHAVVNLKIHRAKPERAALITLGLALLAWLANGIYALSFWQGLMHDLAYRLSETSAANSGWEQYGGWHGFGLALIVLTGVVGAWRKADIGHFIAFAIGSWLLHRLRIETWYEVFGGLAYMLLSLAVLELAMKEAPGIIRSRFRALPNWATASAVVAMLIGINIAATHIPGPKGYIEDLDLDGMVIASGGVDYMTDEDRAAIEAYILDKHADGAKTFEIYPIAETLLIGDLADKGVQFQIPYFDPAFAAGGPSWPFGFGPTEWPNADVYIYRASRYQPRWLDERLLMVIKRGETRAGAKVEVIRSRDATEIWYAVDARAK